MGFIRSAAWMSRFTTCRSSALRKLVYGFISILAILARCAARSYPASSPGGGASGAGCASNAGGKGGFSTGGVVVQAAVVTISRARIALRMDSLLEVRCQRLSGPARELERRRPGFSASTNPANAVRGPWGGSWRPVEAKDGAIID